MLFSRRSLVPLVKRIRELCGTPDTFVLSMAADGWGKPVDLRSPNARRFSLSGALAKAVDDLKLPPEEERRLDKLSNDSNASKRSYATREKRHRELSARVLYGFGWSLLERASVEATGRSLHQIESFEVAMRVLDRAQLHLYESLGMSVRESPLGMARSGDPMLREEIDLLASIEEAGESGATLETIDEVLASYDLYRRRLIVEVVGAPAWTYKLKTNK